MNKDKYDGWKNPHSGYNVQKSGDQLVVTGSYYYRGIEYRYSLRQQSNGPWVMRGRVSPISPSDGHILQVVGRKKTERLNGMEEMPGKRLEKLNITTSIYVASTQDTDIKEAISQAVLRIYSEYTVYLHRVLGEIARPDTIIPSVAAYKYVDEYLDMHHRTASAKTRSEYRKRILAEYVALPPMPMAKYKVSTIKSHCAQGVSKATRELMHRFWKYCLDKGYCMANDPFPPETAKQKSPEKLLASALRPVRLSPEEEDKLYGIVINTPSGPDCGVALQLWGGYAATQASEYRWGDIIWSEDNDYVRVRYFRPDLAGATHDYTCPLFICGARVLRARYDQLLETYIPDQINKMPIVSTVRDPYKPLGADALTQHATMLLRQIGIGNDSLAKLHQIDPNTATSKRLLINTYAYAVTTRCALHSEPGTAQYLLHLSLSGNVSDDHYTSFSSEEGCAHLYAIMSAVRPLEELGPPETCEMRPDGTEMRCYLPDNSRQRVGVVSEYRLAPGEELIVIAPHGMTGSVRAREILPDGKLRKKSRNKVVK